MKFDKKIILNNCKDVFKGIGCFPRSYSIKLKDDTIPTTKSPNRIPINLKEKVKNELMRLSDCKIIEKVEKPTLWVNKMVTVEKSNGQIRICLDPQDLNKAIVKQYYTIPTLSDLQARIDEGKYFSLLDLKDGFCQIKWDNKSSEYCTFGTMDGAYKFLRLPFGLSISSEVFMKFTENAFRDIMSNVFIYVDDFIIFSESLEDHHKALIEVLERARKFNIKFNPKKFQFLITSVKCLAHIFCDGTVKPDNGTIKAIVKFEEPKNKNDIQRFLGMVNYLREYILNLSEMSKPLRDILKKNNEFVWYETHQKNFIKQLITNYPILQNYDNE